MLDIKKHILKYMEDNPMYSFYAMEKIFGIPLKEMLDLLEFRYELTEVSIKILNNVGYHLIDENISGVWTKWEYNKTGQLIYMLKYTGYWQKWEYNKMGHESYYKDSVGDWSKWSYDEFGGIVSYETPNIKT